MNEPDWLKGKALWAWRQLAEALGPKGSNVLARTDRHALSMLCHAYAEWRDAVAQVAREGQVYETETQTGGHMKRKHPAVEIAADAFRRVQSMLVEFGCTPTSRPKVASLADEQVDPLQALLDRKNARVR